MRAILLVSVLAACGAAPRELPPTRAPVTTHRETPTPMSTAPRYYQGSLALPGIELGFLVALTHEGGAWTGTIDVPLQRLHAAPLDHVLVDRERLEFGVAQLGARWSVTLDGDGAPDTCTLQQAGRSFECGLSSIDETRFAELTAPAPAKRPQTPQPPFPYDALDVAYDNHAAGIRLAGTLTVPPGAGPHPAVLLVSGSGSQDRDSTIFGHKPFLVLADHLARHGIAVLRVDDRGVGGSGGDPKTSTTADHVGDALAGVAFLRTQARIDPRRIGIVGHSEGGIVAPAAAVQSKDVAFVVLLAGTGLPGIDVVLDQLAILNRAAGKSDAEVERIVADHRELFALVRDGADPQLVRAKLEQVLAEPHGAAAAVDAQLELLLSPWYRSFLAYDPRPTLQKVRIPVLVLAGDRDTQVRADVHVPAITAALAKNGRVEVHRLAGLNHLFQHATTGLVDEYAAIEETLAPEMLAIVGDWIRARRPRR